MIWDWSFFWPLLRNTPLAVLGFFLAALMVYVLTFVICTANYKAKFNYMRRIFKDGKEEKE